MRFLAGAAAIWLLSFTLNAADFKRDIEPILVNYCFDCHADEMDKGGLELDKYTSVAEHLKNTDMWLAIHKNLQAHLMPPANKRQPTEEERKLLLTWIERDVFKVDPANPDPGRVTIRRLNREEYRYTVLDLLGVNFDVTDAFPPDDTGYGFDTIGDVLSLSPLLMEKYLDAAQEIVAKAVDTSGIRIPTSQVTGDQFKAADNPKKTAKFLPFTDPATVQYSKSVEHPGPYKISLEMQVSGSHEATIHAADLVVKVDGKEVDRRNLGWDNRKTVTFETETTLKKGNNLIALELVPRNPPAEGEGLLNVNVSTVKFQGPLDGSYREYPKQYYRVFRDGPPPTDPKARKEYARKLLRYFADRAFRRPVDEPTLNRLVSLAEMVEKQPGSGFEQGVAHALTAIIASPRFIFRAEIQPEPNNPGRIVRIDEFALASRLSYFLWSSLPDDELFELARKGELRANLRAQVDRMLMDPRSQRFVQNFVGQWLQTRDVETINIDSSRILGLRFPEGMKIFSARVRKAMRQETEMLFEHLMKENLSALDMLVADYTFLNEPLAEFYKIEGVKGNEMRKVSLKPEHSRGGILTHGSLLVVTSNPTRTSPVKRGLFILENLLGTPAPPAPPNVPELEEVRKSSKNATMRELMEIHRQNALCKSCHARMDPLGLALESFSALGMFRDMENNKPIDTAGQLITGEKFQSVQELSQILATSRKEDFYRCLVEKMLTFAIGRGIEYYDTPTIDTIAHTLDADGGKVRTLIYGVVESAPFQKRRGDGDRLADASGE